MDVRGEALSVSLKTAQGEKIPGELRAACVDKKCFEERNGALRSSVSAFSPFAQQKYRFCFVLFVFCFCLFYFCLFVFCFVFFFFGFFFLSFSFFKWRRAALKCFADKLLLSFPHLRNIKRAA